MVQETLQDPNPFLNTADAADIQGDILDGLPKIAELFVFFEIKKVDGFRQKLPAFADRFVTTVRRQQAERTIQAPSDGVIPRALINIAFSKAGLQAVQKDGSLTQNLDTWFNKGMQQDAFALKGPAQKTNRDSAIASENDYVPAWSPQFLKMDTSGTKWTKEIIFDGLMIIAGSKNEIEARLLDVTSVNKSIEGSLEDTIEVVKVLRGKQRDKKAERKHEHFGFLDGVSEPWVKTVDVPSSNANNQRELIDLSEVVLRNNTWMRNGSYMVFRYLVQKVPEFKAFCKTQAGIFGVQSVVFPKGDFRLPKGDDDKPIPGPLEVSPGDVLAARMVGRWPNGVSITEAPPTLGISEQSKINFTAATQNMCPWAAHIRKTGPRDTFSDQAGHHIMRRGIQFGDEVGQNETTSAFLDKSDFLDYTKEEKFRGLLFACYQSSIDKGFHFMQTKWCNTVIFPFENANSIGTSKAKGIDPLIGQVDPLPGRPPKQQLDQHIKIAGMKDPKAGAFNPDSMPLVNELILPAGGEYFFMPSISALKGALNAGKASG